MDAKRSMLTQVLYEHNMVLNDSRVAYASAKKRVKARRLSAHNVTHCVGHMKMWIVVRIYKIGRHIRFCRSVAAFSFHAEICFYSISFHFVFFFVAFSSWSLRVSSPPIADNWKYCICVRACVRFSVCTRPYCCYIYCLIFRIRFVKECQTICPFFSCWLPSHCDASPNDIWPSGGFGR